MFEILCCRFLGANVRSSEKALIRFQRIIAKTNIVNADISLSNCAKEPQYTPIIVNARNNELINW
uniref:Uncharacterized protein n=1 Tax=Parascaris univalens TaxID=6257 RepID=A0A915ATJ3_PARUN